MSKNINSNREGDIFIMYHTSENNQVFKTKKSLLTKSFVREDLQTAYYTKEQYLATCTPFQKEVFELLLEYCHFPNVKIKNETIALRLGCSNKTVTRATNKFLQDGLITKHQQNKYTPNYYTFNEEFKKISFSHWINSLSSHNQYLYITHGIRIDHKNKIIYSLRNVPQYKNNLILDSLFINLSPSSRRREGRIFNKIKDIPRVRPRGDSQKRMNMYNFQDKPVTNANIYKKKRNPGGHSPAVLKPVLPLEDQIHAKKVDIAFYTKQLERPEDFWEERSILFSINISMTKSLLARAYCELEELESQTKRKINEKQILLHQYPSDSMAACSA